MQAAEAASQAAQTSRNGACCGLIDVCARSPVGPQRVPLDIPADNQKVIVVGNWKTFEAGLVQLPLARGVVMGVVALRVGGRHLAQEPPHQAVLCRAENHMPMIRHQRQRKEFDRITLETFSQHAEKRFVVVVFMKECLPCIAAIEGMIDRSPFAG